MAALDRTAACRAQRSVERLAATGADNVKRLQGTDPPEFRLRVGEWRVRFSQDSEAEAGAEHNPHSPRPSPGRRLSLIVLHKLENWRSRSLSGKIASDTRPRQSARPGQPLPQGIVSSSLECAVP